MARKVFFSFHYDRDIWRACIVRNHGKSKADIVNRGYWDKSLWEEAKKKGDAAIKRMIDDGLVGTSVTAVLIGFETWQRPWVNYEIEQSHARGNGMFGIYIDQIKDNSGKTDYRGRNPFDHIMIKAGNFSVPMSKRYPTYHWTNDDGYAGFAGWVEAAAKAADKV
jgi:hypothetical protein